MSELSLVEGVSVLDAFKRMVTYVEDCAFSESSMCYQCGSAVDNLTG